MWFYSLYVSQIKETFLGISTSDVHRRKDQHFIKWLKNQVLTQTLNFCRLIDQTLSYMICISTFSLFSQVDYNDDADYPMWFHEVIQAPLAKVTTSQMYFTRGYTFHIYEYGRQQGTSNCGICVKGETDFYGILQEIIEVEFPWLLKLKCILFNCEWFDHVVNRGVRFNKFGVVDVNGGRRYNKFFFLPYMSKIN